MSKVKPIVFMMIMIFCHDLLLGKSAFLFKHKAANNNFIRASPNLNHHHQKINESIQASICIRFLKWYVLSETRYIGRNFIKSGPPSDTTIMYSVNFQKVNQYKSNLKRTGWVSDKLLESIQVTYDSLATYLKLHPQFDGPIIGFEVNVEVDPIIQLGEEGLLTDHMKNWKIIKSKLLDYHYYYVAIKTSKDLSYGFLMFYINKKWVIDTVIPIY